MSRSLPTLLIILGSVLLLNTLAILLQPATTVQAQCKTPSSCRSCHEVQGAMPVNTQGKTPGSPAALWHAQHAGFDFCVVCHGGDRDAFDKDAAHKGMVVKLSDMPSNCKNCHADDLESRYEVYASVLGVADRSSLQAAQNTGTVNGALEFMNVQAAEIPAETPAAPAGENAAGNAILIGLLTAGVFGGGGYVTWNERRLRRG